MRNKDQYRYIGAYRLVQVDVLLIDGSRTRCEFINVDHIISIREAPEGTRIELTNGEIYTNEEAVSFAERVAGIAVYGHGDTL